MSITAADQDRLSRLRANHLMWSAVSDTQHWDATFFFRLLEIKDQEIAALKARLAELEKQSTAPPCTLLTHLAPWLIE